MRRWSFPIAAATALYFWRPKRTAAFCSEHHFGKVSLGVLGTIGNTPLIEIRSLSEATGCRILAKCEHMNPGGSVKDRAAMMLVAQAEEAGRLRPGDTIVEGTGGNTGIGLALVARAKGYKAMFAMPESIATEKIELMQSLGAEVLLCPGVPFTDERHYFHVARKLGEQPGKFCTEQFENLGNAKAHFVGTGPEIWHQAGHKVDGFVCAAGTGGTIAGCSQFLKSANPKVAVYLIDPAGSGLFDRVTQGPAFEEQGEAAGQPVVWFKRSAGSSITEGIGIGRKTANFGSAQIDGAFQGTDKEAVDMAYYLLRKEGIFVGPSAALNVVGAVKLARKLGKGNTIVTVLCDGGDRYRSKLYNPAWLRSRNLENTEQDSLDFVR